MAAEANEGKALETTVDGISYQRIPVKTRLVGPDDDIVEVVTTFAREHIVDGDIVFVTEKIVAITQGRAYPVNSIKTRPLARFLSKYVTKTSYGIGLGMPETMEMALRECGTPRIMFAAAVSVVSKLLGRSGDFYRIAGEKARAIDGPTRHTIPPYNSHVVLGPERPDDVANELKTALGGRVDVMVVDINDLGGNILGNTLGHSKDDHMVRVLKDNPLGQKHQSTPIGIIRTIA
ncbi:coenzyme F420-0:L-glutamate ligase [Paramicrobacterium agarici]|uniref:F420-0:gamma-glutamyl ligase n=1 Tax=Paramicrobacterium agarici TaxID=630514 RepID=A0A2A9DY58_9MICO|nr:coenzyme F420-0:L-glutamate ligase [Microbacterium agarici]PFG31261.1 F420-0:gamma-glutamyl ligase [Microbacterium agarici]TQO24363.1 F420-0:gamma-glutamyl ligase [Microbacterium agarici]